MATGAELLARVTARTLGSNDCRHPAARTRGPSHSRANPACLHGRYRSRGEGTARSTETVKGAATNADSLAVTPVATYIKKTKTADVSRNPTSTASAREADPSVAMVERVPLVNWQICELVKAGGKEW